TSYVFALSFMLAKNNWSSFLNIAGKHSLYIYLMHLLVVSAVRILLVKFIGIKEPLIILIIGWTLGVVIPIYAYKFMKNNFLKYLFEPPFSKHK
ncbi:MAG: hypothetical protein R3321_11415, partial [Nitrososphaeraceae archaeon]|nr:hypothetical protein [Nitrososphaeraceae archaeon]